MASFICKDCNYDFESELDNISKKCPYCGEMGIIKKPSAAELLED